MTTHFTGLVEALLIPLAHIYMTTHFTDLVEALLIPLTHIYMTTHITDLVEAVKNQDFTINNYIFSNCGGRREHFWGISCEKSGFYSKKSYFFQF
jgi:hypothetical protein